MMKNLWAFGVGFAVICCAQVEGAEAAKFEKGTICPKVIKDADIKKLAETVDVSVGPITLKGKGNIFPSTTTENEATFKSRDFGNKGDEELCTYTFSKGGSTHDPAKARQVGGGFTVTAQGKLPSLKEKQLPKGIQ